MRNAGIGAISTRWPNERNEKPGGVRRRAFSLTPKSVGSRAISGRADVWTLLELAEFSGIKE